MNIETLIKKVKEYNPDSNEKLIKEAYEYAEKKHKGQKRESGEDYITHPLNVAYILAELKLDDDTIAAALLHDVLEDTGSTLEELKKLFGPAIPSLVDGVTKITELKKKNFEEYHAESIRKVIMASAKDIRVIFIKLADKLHNMRTLNTFREEKRKRIAKEVMDVYAPIAYKLGLANLKSELEDLSFKYLETEVYKELEQKIAKSMKQREKEIERVRIALEKILKDNGINSLKIFGRPKHIYSIYKKMQKKNKTFEEIYDLAALRIITQTVKDCYEIIGIIHNTWKPIPNQFDDYIAIPKSNLYQSLHTAVIGPTGQPVEIQVRTDDMDSIAEEGIAAHWKYKGVKGDAKFDQKLSWLRQMLDWQKESKDYKEFMEMLQVDFFEDEIFTFTPKGMVVSLPKGSTILDFAYAIHSNIGDKATGAKVNGKFVPLRTMLKNGDQIEIITSKTQKPSRDWLKIVKTPKASSKIKQFISQHELIPVKRAGGVIEEKRDLAQWIIDVEGLKKPKIKIAQCCNPIPGESIIGYSTKSERVIIHRAGCGAILKKSATAGKKRVNAEWLDSEGTIIEIRVDAINRVGLFAEILNSIISLQTQMKSASAKPVTPTTVECRFTMESRGLQHLQSIITRIQNIQDVKKVYIGSMEGNKAF